jgi:hypothetical protein
VLLASGPWIDKFSLHLDLLLRQLSGNVFPFLADFFTEEGTLLFHAFTFRGDFFGLWFRDHLSCVTFE